MAFFFDFDGRITLSIWISSQQNYAVSDAGRRHVIESLSDEEVVANFGGSQRIAELKDFFGGLRSRGAKLFVISHGLAAVIRPHLAHPKVALDGCFDAIYGTDTEELKRCGGGHSDKAILISHLMEHLKLAPRQAAFFEDTKANLLPAEKVCGCILVDRKTGLDTATMNAVVQKYYPSS